MAMDFMISDFGKERSSSRIYHRRRKNIDGNFLNDTNNPQSLISGFEDDGTGLPPEIEEGNVEYKVKLVNPSATRMQHLITQMKWRLREGQGEAIYEIGVEDDGTLSGLTDKELDASMRTLKRMTNALNASIVLLSERCVTPKNETCRRRVVELLIRKVPDNQQFIELRLALLGDENVGKSTICGILTQGHLDNGQGKARLNLFRYLHEFQTGHTSSICLDVIGFDGDGNLINYLEHSLEEIVEKSTKLITLIDLAGDRKYLKTTIYGLTGYLPHFAAIVISALSGCTATTREHLGLAIALNIPVFIIVTKVDTVSKAACERVLKGIEALLKRSGMECKPKRVTSSDDVVNCASSMLNQNIIPVFLISNVTGHNLYLIEHFLNVLPPSGSSKLKKEEISAKAPLFSVEEVFHVPQDYSSTNVNFTDCTIDHSWERTRDIVLHTCHPVGLVVCGVLIDGVLSEKERVQIGPFRDGSYQLGVIDSIRRNRQPVRSVRPGEAASVALALENSVYEDHVRRGMVMLNSKDEGISCRRFISRLYLLCHPANEICIGFQGTVYLGSVRQTATIVGLDAPSVVPCKWVTVQFEFYNSPEFVRVGTPLIFREGKTKGMGEVIEVLNF